MPTTDLATPPGPFLADTLGGRWHPDPLFEDPDQVSGHLEIDGVFLYLGMGFTESDGAWLQVAYMYAKPAIDAKVGDESACGRGAGTRVVNALKDWTNLTGIPLRFVAIENPGFFARFDCWSDDTFEHAEWGDGEAWYYPETNA